MHFFVSFVAISCMNKSACACLMVACSAAIASGCTNGDQALTTTGVPRSLPVPLAGAERDEVSIKLWQDESGARITTRSAAVTKQADKTLRWTFPGEAPLEVALPFHGTPPDRVVLYFVRESPQGEIEIGSVATAPSVNDGVLRFSVKMPVLAMEAGTHNCIFRTESRAGKERKMLHEAKVEITFSKAASSE